MSNSANFLIIGAQKAGTTSAARNLAQHPDIFMFSGKTEYGQKEIEYFNQHWERGGSWYASHFGGGVLRGEKTAELLHRTICHERMYLTNAKFKLIVLLRSPVERAYSQWKMAAFHKRDERSGFDEVVTNELAVLESCAYRHQFGTCTYKGLSSWREGYLLKGMYAEQLESVYRWFAREQVFIAITERLRSNLAGGYAKMFEFLGVQPGTFVYTEHFVSSQVVPMSERIRSVLRDVYREPNKHLRELLADDIPEWQD